MAPCVVLNATLATYISKQELNTQRKCRSIFWAQKKLTPASCSKEKDESTSTLSRLIFTLLLFLFFFFIADVLVLLLFFYVLCVALVAFMFILAICKYMRTVYFLSKFLDICLFLLFSFLLSFFFFYCKACRNPDLTLVILEYNFTYLLPTLVS